MWINIRIFTFNNPIISNSSCFCLAGLLHYTNKNRARELHKNKSVRRRRSNKLTQDARKEQNINRKTFLTKSKWIWNAFLAFELLASRIHTHFHVRLDCIMNFWGLKYWAWAVAAYVTFIPYKYELLVLFYIVLIKINLPFSM